MHILRFLPLLLLLWACARHDTAFDAERLPLKYAPRYAGTFEVRGSGASSLLVTRAPWQGADSTVSTMLFLRREGEPLPEGYRGPVLDDVPRRIVCMSSTHIAMLDAVGAADAVCGVSGLKYVTTPAVRDRRDTLREVGYEEALDYETLLSLRPDLVTLYGVTGASALARRLDDAGIPYIYVSEYLEEDPLGRAEWMVAFGELAGRADLARSAFERIPAQYDSLRQLVQHAALPPPGVMINTPYADAWLMASTSSYVARLIADAGGDYLYRRNTANYSRPISLEEAFRLASGADIWLNVGTVANLAELRGLYPRFADTPPVAHGQVWNCDRRMNADGGNDYWESGPLHPHLVLADLINIFHPGLLADSTMTYYRQLP